MNGFKSFFLGVLANCASIQAEAAPTDFDVCAEDAALYERSILPKLGKGIPVILGIAVAQGERIEIIREMRLRRDLWKKTQMLRYDGSEQGYVSDKEFVVALCTASRVPFPADRKPTGWEWLLLFNPPEAEVERILSAWAERNAGVYRYLGIRFPWLENAKEADAPKVLLRRKVQP